MSYKGNIAQKLSEIFHDKQRVDVNTEEGYFNKISVPLAALEDLLREQIQDETSNQVSRIIQKLISDEEITEDDLKLIRLWVIGDAESYIKMENDFTGWIDELNRLLSVIDDFKNQELTLEKMIKLSGTVCDATRVIADIVFFKQEKERILNFENASKVLTTENKIVLANILNEKFLSDQM